MSIGKAKRKKGVHQALIQSKNRVVACRTSRSSVSFTWRRSRDSSLFVRKIRINLIRPLPFSSAELRSASAQDLKDVEAEFSAGIAKIMAAMGVKLLAVVTPKIEMINGSPALLLEYRRSDLLGPSPWTVKQYKIPAGDKLIELTISYRESDAFIWKPILEYVKQSLRL